MQSDKRRSNDSRNLRRGPRFVPTMISAEDIISTNDPFVKTRRAQTAVRTRSERVINSRVVAEAEDRPALNFRAIQEAVWNGHDRFIENVGTPALMFIACILLCVVGYVYQHTQEKGDYSYVDGDLTELTIKAFRMPGTLTRPIRSQQLGFLSEKIKTINRKVDSDDLARVIIEQATSHAFDPLIIASIIKTESAFKRKAVSHKGAKGLMQLMPATAKYIADVRGIEWKGLSALNDPDYNLLLGISYFDYLLDMFDNDVELALMAYNWGPGNIQRVMKSHGRVIPEVREYARGILLTHKRWKTEQYLSGI